MIPVHEILDPMNDGFVPDLFADPAEDDRRTVIGEPPKITELGNKSIGFANLTQSLTLDQPVYQPSGINNLGCIEYVNDLTTEKLVSFNNIAAGAPNFFMQFVWRYTDTISAGSNYMMSIVLNTTGTIQYLMLLEGATGLLLSRPWRQFTGTIGGIYSTFVLVQNQPYIIEVLYDRDNLLHSLTINGSLQGTSASMITDSVNKMNIATNHPSGPFGLKSQYAPILIQNQIPSPFSIERRRRYLANRYNIAI